MGTAGAGPELGGDERIEACGWRSTSDDRPSGRNDMSELLELVVQIIEWMIWLFGWFVAGVQ